jgi:hypothetical protein
MIINLILSRIIFKYSNRPKDETNFQSDRYRINSPTHKSIFTFFPKKCIFVTLKKSGIATEALANQE